MKPPFVKRRCAVYTRKSTEEGLDMAFNSLDAQREACEAYVQSQKAEGWILVPDRYDDGGFSGGNLERPALKRLLADIEAGRVDVVVVYKIDRLSRRLTLNVLLSFAQFEREVIGERIRDKIAASKRRGMWMGGYVPLGYDVVARQLVINPAEAETISMIFRRFAQLRSAVGLIRELRAAGIATKSGRAPDKVWLHKLLRNRLYLGEIVHRGTAHPGQHQAIVTAAQWERVHAILKEDPRRRGAASRAQTPALLKGLVFSEGRAMSPTHTRKRGRLYRYYVSQAILKDGASDAVGRVPAAQIEAAIVDQLRGLLRSPEIIVGTWREAQREGGKLSETEVREALVQLDPLWNELFSAEQARIVRLLVERVDVGPDGMEIRLNVSGIDSIARDLSPRMERAA